jgi:hypothetical protein
VTVWQIASTTARTIQQKQTLEPVVAMFLIPTLMVMELRIVLMNVRTIQTKLLQLVNVVVDLPISMPMAMDIGIAPARLRTLAKPALEIKIR